MKIKINKNPYKIKPASELTVKEHILIFENINQESDLELLIKYISITTGVKYNHIADIDINQVTTRRLFAYIGKILQASDMPESEEFYYKKTGKKLYRKSINWRSMGVRSLIERRESGGVLEQTVYLLAIYISCDYDNEKIEDIYNELQDYNAIDVFGFIFFFSIKFQNGKNLGKNFLRRLLKKVNISIRKLLNK